jgi:hypothetical protein
VGRTPAPTHRTARAAHTTACVFGVLAGLGGLTHGVGEVLQGGVPVRFALDSWISGPMAEHMGGEPAFTVLPTAGSAGVATLALSTAVIGCSAFGIRRRHGGSALMLLSGGMLLAGGGFAPPLIGILAGAVGRWSEREPRWLARLGPHARRRLARAWGPLFALSVANATFLVVGSVVLVYRFGLHAPEAFVRSFLATVLLQLGLLAAAPAADAVARTANEHA